MTSLYVLTNTSYCNMRTLHTFTMVKYSTVHFSYHT